MCYFGVACVVSFVRWYCFFAGFFWDRNMWFYISQTADCVLFTSEEQIKSSFHSLYSECFLNPFLSWQILLKSKKGSFVLGVLSNLYTAGPVVGCKLFFAVIALGMLLNEGDNFCLLNFCRFVYWSYEFYLYSDSFRVRFCPDEFCIFYLQFWQPFYFLQEDCK